MQKDVRHWTMTRLTSLPLVPLFFYFVAQGEYLTTKVRMEFISWVREPVTAGALFLFIVCSFWHARLGMEEIIIDYIPSKSPQGFFLLVNKLFFFFLGAACLYALWEIRVRKI